MKKRIFVVVIISSILIISSFFFLFAFTPIIDKKVSNNYEIKFSSNDIRTNQEILIRILNCSKNDNITWKINRTTTKYGNPITIVFQTSAYYDINVILKNKNGKFKINNTLPVKNSDYNIDADGFPINDINPFSQTSIQNHIPIFQGISIPQIKIIIQIPQASGKISVDVWLDRDSSISFIVQKEYTFIREEALLNYNISSDIIDPISSSMEIYCDLIVENGRISNFYINIGIYY